MDIKIGDKFNHLTVVMCFPSNKRFGKVVCQCDCGKYTELMPGSNVQRGNKKSCGHCDDPEIGDRFGKLVVAKILPGKLFGCQVICKCDCGNTTEQHTFSRIKTGLKTSCGKCNLPKMGDRMGELVVTEIIEAFNGSGRVVCTCKCGQTIGPIDVYDFYSGKYSTCGNCHLKRNGVYTSLIALQLHDIIEDILGAKCEHNLKHGKYYIDIANVENKIAIEYDGYYWHKDTEDSNEIKKQQLIDSGWQVLTIQSGGRDLPSKEDLAKVLLNHFQHDMTEYTITMPSWSEAQKRC